MNRLERWIADKPGRVVVPAIVGASVAIAMILAVPLSALLLWALG